MTGNLIHGHIGNASLTMICTRERERQELGGVYRPPVVSCEVNSTDSSFQAPNQEGGDFLLSLGPNSKCLPSTPNGPLGQG